MPSLVSAPVNRLSRWTKVDDGQAALFLARSEGEDEVAEVVVEEIDFAFDSPRSLTQGQIESVAALGLETGIAHLEDQCAHVGAQVVEFLECRDSVGVGKVGDEGPAPPQVRVHAGRRGGARETASNRVGNFLLVMFLFVSVLFVMFLSLVPHDRALVRRTRDCSERSPNGRRTET